MFTQQLNALVLVAAASAAAAEPAAQALPESRHFQLQTLAPGVWAAIATPGGSAICNTGIIDLGDQVVLFDVGQHPRAAADLTAAAQQLTGRAPTIIVLSHGHSDHAFGASGAPAGAQVIGTEQTRDYMVEDAKDAPSDGADLARRLVIVKQYEDWEARYGGPGEARFWRGYVEAIVESTRNYTPRLPTRIMQPGESIRLSGPRRAIELRALAGHTKGDVFAVLPTDHIVFAGDLLFVGHQPFLGDSPGTDQYLNALHALETSGATQFVPGHGPVAGGDAIESMRSYIVQLRALVRQGKDLGIDVDWLSSRGAPPQYANWWFGRFFSPNVKKIYAELATSQAH